MHLDITCTSLVYFRRMKPSCSLPSVVEMTEDRREITADPYLAPVDALLPYDRRGDRNVVLNHADYFACVQSAVGSFLAARCPAVCLSYHPENLRDCPFLAVDLVEEVVAYQTVTCQIDHVVHCGSCDFRCDKMRARQIVGTGSAANL